MRIPRIFFGTSSTKEIFAQSHRGHREEVQTGKHEWWHKLAGAIRWGFCVLCVSKDFLSALCASVRDLLVREDFGREGRGTNPEGLKTGQAFSIPR